MTVAAVAATLSRGPFRRRRKLVRTGVYERLSLAYEQAIDSEDVLLVCAPPGAGKTTAARELSRRHGGEKTGTRITLRVPHIECPKGKRVTNSTLAWSVERVMGRTLEREERDAAEAIAKMLLESDAEGVVFDDAQSYDLTALNAIRGLFDIFEAAERPLAVILLGAQVTSKPEESEPWPTLLGPDPDMFQLWRRLTVRHPVTVPGQTWDEAGDLIATYERLWRPDFPDLDLMRWHDDIWGIAEGAGALGVNLGAPTVDTVLYLVNSLLRAAWALDARDVPEDVARKALDQARRDLRR
jgi:hypothetical protein